MFLSDKQKNIICDYFYNKPVIKAFLFGSYVRGEANTLSDIDILIEIDYSYPIGFELIDFKYDLQNLLSCKVDLLTTRSLTKILEPVIDSEKKLIYAR